MSLIVRALFVLALLILPAAAHAETNIAVVDLQKIMTESKAAVNIQEQVQAYREKSQAQIGAIEEKLREEQKVLTEGKESLPPEEFAAKKASFEQSLSETRNMVQEKKLVLDEAFTSSVTTLRDEILKIVAEISEERGYQLVLTRSNVVLVEKPFDITDEVMAQINTRMTTVKLDIKSQ